MVQTTISSYGEKEDKKYPKVVRKDKDSSKGPFKCCYEITKKTNKKISYKGLDYNYDVWLCNVCNKEYLDTKQSKKLEKFWLLEKILEDKFISMKRKMNFDGRTFFFRFPKELTGSWSKGNYVNIKIINPEMFLVEINDSN